MGIIYRLTAVVQRSLLIDSLFVEVISYFTSAQLRNFLASPRDWTPDWVAVASNLPLMRNG